VIRRRRGLGVKARVQGARVKLRGPDRARSLPDCGRGGWGRAGRLGGPRAAKVGEDGLDGEGVLDGSGDQHRERARGLCACYRFTFGMQMRIGSCCSGYCSAIRTV